MSNVGYRLEVTQAAVAALCASPAGHSRLLARRRAITKLLEQCTHMFPWPALESSLRADLARIDAALSTNRSTLP